LKPYKKKSTGKVTYVGGASFNDATDIQKAVEEAKNNDVIVLCLGEKPYTETAGNIDSLNLDQAQLELANAMIATGKPVILVTLGGRPRIITSIAEQVPGVILGFLPGMEGGEAIADILYGDYNPNGKLPLPIRETPTALPRMITNPSNRLSRILITPYIRLVMA